MIRALMLLPLTAPIMIVGVVAKPLGNPRLLTENEKKIVVRSVEGQLKDPDAAKYRWFLYNGSDHYCGLINAKNSYGGYIGYQHYYVKVQKDTSGSIKTAINPSFITADSPVPELMTMVCESAARADSEDKTPIQAEP